MNKKVLLGASIGAIALGASAYVGTAWYAGSQIEKQMQAGIGELQKVSPLLKVSDVKVKRGIFRTEHEMTLALNADCLDSGMGHDNGKMQEALDKIKIRMRHTITHGPLSFAGGIQPALASYEGRFILDEKAAQELAKVLGDKPVLSWSGVLQFGGSHQFKLQSPAFAVKDESVDLAWDGIQGEGSGNINDRSYKLALRAPKLEFKGIEMESGEPGQGLIENIQIAAEGRPGANKIGIGTASFNVDKFRLGGSRKGMGVEMSQVGYTAQVKEAGQFVDVLVAYRIAGLLAGAEKKKFGPATMELALDHLHAPTILAFDDSMKRFMCAAPDKKPELAVEIMGQWKQLAATLLQNQPVLRLQQIKLAMPEGEVSGKGRLSLVGFEPAMLESPQAALAALPGIVQIEFSGQTPEKLVLASFRDFAVKRGKRAMMLDGSEDVPPEQLRALQEHAEQDAKQQLTLALARNYIKQEGELLTFSFSYGKGQAKLNGTSIDLPFLPQKDAAAPDDGPKVSLAEGKQ